MARGFAAAGGGELSLRVFGDLFLVLCWGVAQVSAVEKAEVAHADRMLQWFEYSHLPPALQKVSGSFSMLAHAIVADIAGGPERTVALRKLLEAKDAAVRAAVSPGG